MNKGQEQFVERGKLMWQKGMLLAFRTRLSQFHAQHPDMRCDEVLNELQRIQVEFEAKCSLLYPTKAEQQGAKHATRPPK